MAIVVIDDERTLKIDGNVDHFRDARSGLGYLATVWTTQVQYSDNTNVIDQLFLDHDLGDGLTVNVIVRWLETIAYLGHPLAVKKIYVHSMNIVGAASIVATLSRWYNVERIPLPAEMR